MTTKCNMRNKKQPIHFTRPHTKSSDLVRLPKWNFHKYLITRDQKLVDYFHSTTAPNAKRVTQAIEKSTCYSTQLMRKLIKSGLSLDQYLLENSFGETVRYTFFSLHYQIK